MMGNCDTTDTDFEELEDRPQRHMAERQTINPTAAGNTRTPSWRPARLALVAALVGVAIWFWASQVGLLVRNVSPEENQGLWASNGVFAMLKEWTLI